MHFSLELFLVLVVDYRDEELVDEIEVVVAHEDIGGLVYCIQEGREEGLGSTLGMM